MLNKYNATILSVIALTIATPVLAEDRASCRVEVAISTPPVLPGQHVSFNVTGNYTNNSIVLNDRNPFKIIDDLVCSEKEPYLISATLWSASIKGMTDKGTTDTKQPIGQCILRSGPVFLGLPGNSVSVVFPNDFICNTNL